MEIFDLATIKPATSIQIIGKRCTGKTYLIKNIMYLLSHQYDVEFVIVCPAAKTHNCYNDMKYESLYYSLDNLVILSEIIKENTILILDDCITRHNDYDIIHNLSINSFRNIIFSFQYLHQRTIKTDLTIFFQEQLRQQRHHIYEKYFDKKIYSLDIFNDIFDTHTQNNHALVIKRDLSITTCCAENINTYISHYYATHLQYDNTVNIIYRIYNKFSMFYQSDNILYAKLFHNFDFIVKCNYIWFHFRCSRYTISDYWLPCELYKSILCIMVQSYKENEFYSGLPSYITHDYDNYQNTENLA